MEKLVLVLKEQLRQLRIDAGQGAAAGALKLQGHRRPRTHTLIK